LTNLAIALLSQEPNSRCIIIPAYGKRVMAAITLNRGFQMNQLVLSAVRTTDEHVNGVTLNNTYGWVEHMNSACKLQSLQRTWG
jgi:hypothetical protein